MGICDDIWTQKKGASNLNLKKKSDGQTDKVIAQQELMSGSLTIVELTKIYRFLLWKFVSFILKEVF